MRVWLAVALLFALPAMAQDIPARSGEHPGFSRIVLEIPRGTSWSLTQTGRAARLALGVPQGRVDTSRVFDRIPRSRIAGLSQSGAGADLVFDLGCRCEVEGFLQGERYLVIDVKDPVEEVPPVVPPVRVALPLTQQPYRFALPGGDRASNDAAPPQSPQPPQLPLPVVQPASAITLPLPEPLSDGQGDQVAIMRQQLMEQVGRASSQGLLSLRGVSAAATEVIPDAGTVAGRGQAPHLDVTTAIDRDLADVARRLGGSGASVPCTDRSRVDLAGWGADTPFPAQLAGLRSRLYGEFDRTDNDAALRLARLYLRYGFGAEAVAVMKLMQPPAQDGKLMLALALVMDDLPPLRPNPLGGQQDCAGETALWSLLSEPTPAGEVDTQAVQQAFARLPPHLRSHLGPRLGRILAELGEEVAAGAVLRTVDRDGAGDAVAVDMARAAIARHTGAAGEEVARLETVVASGSDHTPQAIVELVDAHMRDGTATGAELPDLAAAVAVEHRRETDGPELRRARTLALAAAGRFDEAMQSLDDLAQRDGASARASVRQQVLVLLADRAEDLVFLKHVLSEIDAADAPLPGPLAETVAARLLGLGFADAALALMETRDGPAASEARRVLRARAALALGKPHRAMVELLGLDGAEANRLRASAMWMNGDHAAAGQLLLTSDAPEAAARTLWLAQEFDAVPATGSGGYLDAARTAAALSAAGEQTAGLAPLAEARALVQDSTATREQVVSLLAGLTANGIDPHMLATGGSAESQ